MTNNHVIDRLLVAKAQAGDEEAFTLLVRRWNPKLVGFCARLSGNMEAGRDVAQETWVSAVKSLNKLDDPALFRAWLFKIAKRRAADHIQKIVRERKKEDAMREMVTITETKTSGPEEGLNLKAMIDGMPREKRALLILFYVEGLSLIELAEVFEIPKGTVKSRLFNAKHELKIAYERKKS